MWTHVQERRLQDAQAVASIPKSPHKRPGWSGKPPASYYPPKPKLLCQGLKQIYKIVADQYLQHGDKTRAAIYAGYKSSVASATASRILKRADVQEYIQKMQMKAENHVEWTHAHKIRKLKQIADIAVPDDATTADEISAKLVSPAIAAIAEANKMQGHYSADKIVTVNVGIDADIQQVKDILDNITRGDNRE